MALSAEEQAELAALQGAAPTTPNVVAPGQPASGLSPEEQAELQALQKPAASHPIKDAAISAGTGILKGLDYAGGAVRTTVAQLLEHKLKGLAAVGQLAGAGTSPDDVSFTRPSDIPDAIKGQAPRTADYLDRAGVPKGAELSDAVPSLYSSTGKGLSLKKGGALDPSVRGVAGLAGDVALDPLTYLSGGLSSVAKGGQESALKALLLANEQGLNGAGKVANAVLNPVETLSRSGAKSAYSKAFEKVDSKFDKPNTLAEMARETGFWGSPESAVEHFQGMNKKSGEAIGDIMGQASEKGAKVDLETALQPALVKANELRNLGTKESVALADQIESRVKDMRDAHAQYESKVIPGVPAEYETPMYGAERMVPGTGTAERVEKIRTGSSLPVDEANKVKTNLNSFTNFNPSDIDAIANQGRKAVATPLSASIKDSVKGADQELYDRLMQENATFSSTSPKVTSKLEQFANQAPQQKGPFGMGKMDSWLGAAGVGGAAAGHESALLPFLAGKAYQAGASFEGRTARGAVLNKIGNKSDGVLDEMLRQLISEQAAKGNK